MTAETEIVDTIKAHVDDKFVAKADIAPLANQLAEMKNDVQKMRLTVPTDLRRSGTLKCFKTAETAYAFGMQILATLHRYPQLQNTNTQKGFDWCKANGLDVTKAAQAETINTLGGYTVFDQISNDIIDLREMYGVFRKNARVIPMTSDHIKINRRTGGLTGYWVGEGAALTQSNKTWDQISLTPKKRGILVLWSTELNEDSVVNLADDLAREAAYEFSTVEDQCGFIGDGTSTYAGMRGVAWKFETENTSLAGYAQAASGHNTTATLTLADFHQVLAKLPEYARITPGVAWYCSSAFYAAVMQRLLYAQGGNTVAITAGPSPYSFLGYPVVISQILNSTVGSVSSKVMALFGNLRLAATMGVRRDITVDVSTEYAFANDQIALKATERFDINVHDVGNNTTPGPIVALVSAA